MANYSGRLRPKANVWKRLLHFALGAVGTGGSCTVKNGSWVNALDSQFFTHFKEHDYVGIKRKPNKAHIKAVRITVGGKQYDMYPERIKQ